MTRDEFIALANSKRHRRTSGNLPYIAGEVYDALVKEGVILAPHAGGCKTEKLADSRNPQ